MLKPCAAPHAWHSTSWAPKRGSEQLLALGKHADPNPGAFWLAERGITRAVKLSANAPR